MKRHWTRKFGVCNLDLLAGTAYPESGYGFPELAPADFPLPARLIPFNAAMRLNRIPKDCGVHFFLDDYQFERVWNAPERYVERLRKFACALTPDFSLFLDMPPAMKIWNAFRARLVGKFWQESGVRVVPAVSWAEPETFGFCFEGLPKGAALAVARIGVGAYPYCRYIWDAGFREALRRLAPSTLILYSNSDGALPAVPAGTRLVRFDAFARSRFRASSLKKENFSRSGSPSQLLSS